MTKIVAMNMTNGVITTNTMNKDLYKQIYKYSKEFREKNNETPPTYEQIGDHFGFTREYARQCFERMEKEGYVFRLRKHRVFWGWNIERFTKHNKQ